MSGRRRTGGRSIRWEIERFPVRGSFTISRSSLSEITVVTVTVAQGGVVGRGECRPYPRYAETPESVVSQISDWVRDIRFTKADALLDFCRTLPGGAAANAVESAVIDLLCKLRGVRAWELLGARPPTERVTAFTISAASPDAMAEKAREADAYSLLKVKVGGGAAVAQFEAVARARPDAAFIVDANEALDAAGLVDLARACIGHEVRMIEQPLAAGSHTALPQLPDGAPPVCADESLHGVDDLGKLWAAGYRAVNVKLDKTGGPLAALDLIRAASRDGFSVMAGCMVGTSLAMAPMVCVSEEADVLDLDGPLLLERDREVALSYAGAKVGVPPPELWG